VYRCTDQLVHRAPGQTHNLAVELGKPRATLVVVSPHWSTSDGPRDSPGEFETKAAHHEILAQRDQIGELLGQVRDLQTHWTEEDLMRVVNDNCSLKKQVRQLTNDNTDLKNKLAAARDNARFTDKRIAALEAEYASAILR
jgi:hypothetical protein